MMENYFTENYQNVTLPTCYSGSMLLHQDVPQGTLGPLLMRNYVNVMPRTVIDKCSFIQLADDRMIF